MKFRHVLEDYVIDEWIEFYIEFLSLTEQLKNIDLGPKENSRLRSSSFHWNNAHAFQIKGHPHQANNQPLPLGSSQPLKQIEEGSEPSMNGDDSPIKYPLLFKPTERNLWEARLKENIEKVEAFYNDKRHEIEHFFNYFIDSVKKVYQKEAFKKNRFFSDLHEKASVSAEQISLRYGNRKIMSEIYTELLCLESFCIMNTLSANILLKQYIKKFTPEVTTEEVKEMFHLEKYHFTNPENFTKLKDVIIDYVVRHITNGDSDAAIDLLRKNSHVKIEELAKIAFFLGIVCSALFVLIVIAYIEFQTLGSSLSAIFFSSFQVFRFVFCSLLVFWYIPIARYYLQMHHLNFNFVLDIRPSNMGDIQQYIKLNTHCTFVFLILVLLDVFFCSSLANSSNVHGLVAPNVIGLVLFLCTIIVFFMPLKSFLIDMKFALGKLAMQCIGSPFTTVAFIHILTADCMTSFNKPILDIINSFCWVYEGGWRDASASSSCNFPKAATICILSFPYYLRFMQCLKRYYVTKLVFPNIFNAIKYALSIATIVLGQFSFTIYPNLLTAFYCVGFTSYLYNNYWDNYNDWGLFRTFSGPKMFLRPKITFTTNFYYTIMVLNFFLRLNSLASLVPPEALTSWFEDPNLFLLLIEVLEITRRFLWAIIRVEHEIFTNFEKLRDFWTVPNVYYMNDRRKKKKLQAL